MGSVTWQVVAPVRETCAQTIGVMARYLTAEGVKGMVGVILKLFEEKQWEVRHGGLLSLKYVLAVRQVRSGSLESYYKGRILFELLVTYLLSPGGEVF